MKQPNWTEGVDKWTIENRENNGRLDQWELKHGEAHVGWYADNVLAVDEVIALTQGMDNVEVWNITWERWEYDDLNGRPESDEDR